MRPSWTPRLCRTARGLMESPCVLGCDSHASVTVHTMEYTTPSNQVTVRAAKQWNLVQQVIEMLDHGQARRAGLGRLGARTYGSRQYGAKAGRPRCSKRNARRGARRRSKDSTGKKVQIMCQDLQNAGIQAGAGTMGMATRRSDTVRGA
jgi:hypothetical protein